MAMSDVLGVTFTLTPADEQSMLLGIQIKQGDDVTDVHHIPLARGCGHTVKVTVIGERRTITVEPAKQEGAQG